MEIKGFRRKFVALTYDSVNKTISCFSDLQNRTELAVGSRENLQSTSASRKKWPIQIKIFRGKFVVLKDNPDKKR